MVSLIAAEAVVVVSSVREAVAKFVSLLSVSDLVNERSRVGERESVVFIEKLDV